jgi:hypothetical protein
VMAALLTRSGRVPEPVQAPAPVRQPVPSLQEILFSPTNLT